MKNIDNIFSSLHCAVIGDIIGFGNGIVEFNYHDKRFNNAVDRFTISDLSLLSYRHVVDFISRGGYTNIDISKNIASDDSVLLLAVFDGLITSKKEENEDKIVDNIKNKIIEYIKLDYKNETFKDRYYGIRTTEAMNRIINEKKNWEKFAFSENAGGCGASMRSMAIGLIYSEPKDFVKLMHISIQSSRITHNNPIGYLGGFMSALFTSFAIQEIEPEKWIFKLIEILKTDQIIDFIKNTVTKYWPKEYDLHTEEYYRFLDLCEKYVSLRFKDKKFINLEEKISMRFFELRSTWYYEEFKAPAGYPNQFFPGSNGFDSVIIAYDALLDCNGSFETLIYYAMLHAGDSDSTGCIAGAFYGAYYGKFDLPKSFYKIEFMDGIKKLVNSM